MGAYKFIKDIGRGNFSKVKLANHQLTRDNVAVKIIDRSRLDSRAMSMLSSEVLTLESLHHPHILRLFEVIEMWNRVYLITEFVAGGELYNKISLEGAVREEAATVLFGQLLSAVKYMHANSFVHRDIKAENVLLVTESQVKLADFGFSTRLKEPMEKLDTFCGSPPYAAPELFTEDHYIGQFVDVWALGVLLYFMVVGNMPFRAPTVPALRAAVLRGHYLLPSTLSQPCIRVIQRVLVQTPSHRPSLDDLANCQWMRRAGEGEREVGVANTQSTTVKKKKTRLIQFWKRSNTSVSSSTSSQSGPGRGGGRRRVEEVVPIACSTKRSESVLDANYLFPIEEQSERRVNCSARREEELEEGALKRSAPRRSLFSFGVKTKIGPMDDLVVLKGGGGGVGVGVGEGQLLNNYTTNNNNNHSPSHWARDQQQLPSTNNGTKVFKGVGEEQQMKHSSSSMYVDVIEGKVEEVGTIAGGVSEDFEMAPTFVTGSHSCPDQVETEALRLLNNWGISNEMLSDAVASGARNELMGIYRIVVHRLQMQQERQKLNTKDQADQGETKKMNKTTKKKLFKGKGDGGCTGKCPRNSSNCVIL